MESQVREPEPRKTNLKPLAEYHADLERLVPDGWRMTPYGLVRDVPEQPKPDRQSMFTDPDFPVPPIPEF